LNRSVAQEINGFSIGTSLNPPLSQGGPSHLAEIETVKTDAC